MTFSKILEIINGKKLWDFEERKYSVAGATDMLSELLAFGKDEMVLITGLCTPQMVNTADIVGVGAIIIVRGKDVPRVTVNAAKEMGIPLVVTDLTMYTVCGRLFCTGLNDIYGKGKN